MTCIFVLIYTELINLVVRDPRSVKYIYIQEFDEYFSQN